jgi:hypothetical protein
VARAYAGHQRAAEGSALFGGEHFDGMAVDAGLNAPPQGAARAAAAQPDAADRNAQLGKQRERVLKRIGNALQHRADKVSRRVVDADAGEGRAHFRVEMRRAFAEQIRRPFQALAAGGNLRRARGQAS